MLAETGRVQWIAQATARLADTALLRGDRQRADALLCRARELYASKRAELGASLLDARLDTLKRR